MILIADFRFAIYDFKKHLNTKGYFLISLLENRKSAIGNQKFKSLCF